MFRPSQLAVPFCLLVACSGPATAVDLPLPKVRITVRPPSDCGDRPAAPFARVADGASEVRANICGDLLYRASALHLRRADGTDTVLEGAIAAELDLTGRYALHARTTGATLVDLASGTQAELPGAVSAVGFGYDEAARRPVPWLITPLGVVIAGSGEEPIAGSAGVGGAVLLTSRYGVHLAALAGGTALIVDLVARTTRSITLPSTSAADFARLTPDGRVLVHQPAVTAQCGVDALCQVATGPATLYRTDTGEVVWQAPVEVDLQKNGYDRSGMFWSDTGHALAFAGIFVTANRPGATLIDTATMKVRRTEHTFFSFLDSGEAVVFGTEGQTYSVWAVDPAEAGGERALVSEALLRPAGVPRFVISPRGDTVAFSRWTRGVETPAGSTVAHVHDVVVRIGSKEQVVARTEELHPVGIGPCGDLLFSGWRFGSEPPQTAPQSETSWYAPEPLAWSVCGAPAVALPQLTTVDAAAELSDAQLLLAARTSAGSAAMTLERATGKLRELTGGPVSLISPPMPSGFATVLVLNAERTLFHGRP